MVLFKWGALQAGCVAFCEHGLEIYLIQDDDRIIPEASRTAIMNQQECLLKQDKVYLFTKYILAQHILNETLPPSPENLSDSVYFYLLCCLNKKSIDSSRAYDRFASDYGDKAVFKTEEAWKNYVQKWREKDPDRFDQVVNNLKLENLQIAGVA